MKPKIYCDQDGVLADWAKFAAERFNIDFTGYVYVKLTEAEWHNFQATCPNMWYELDHMPYALDLWKLIRPYNPTILTALPHEAVWEGCGEQKLRWAQDKLPNFDGCELIACQREEKVKYAVTDGVPNILIDDMERNIIEWQNAGGIGVGYRADGLALKVVEHTLATYF